MLRRKVMQQMLVERAERIDLLEQQLDTAQKEKARTEEMLSALRSREQTIVETLTNAQQAAKQSLSEADARGKRIVGDAKAEAERILSEARGKSARIVAQAQASAAEYAQTLAEYNETVERAAEEAAKSAASYAAFVKTRRLDVPSLVREAEQLGQEPFVREVELPPVDDDPAQLMQNIYKIQNRAIPDVAMPASEPEPVYAPPRAERAPEPKPEPKPEPERAPEPAREEAPVPTVEQLVMSVSAEDDGLSLDALLDEIIKAGE